VAAWRAGGAMALLLDKGTSSSGISLDRLLENDAIRHRLFRLEPQAAAEICKDWLPSHGVTSDLIVAVGALGLRASAPLPPAAAGADSAGGGTVSPPGRVKARVRKVACNVLCHFFFSKVLDVIRQVAEGETEALCDGGGMQPAQLWTFVRESAEILGWVVSRADALPELREFCLARGAARGLLRLSALAAEQDGTAVLPVLGVLRALLCRGGEAAEQQLSFILDDFCSFLASHLEPWLAIALLLRCGADVAKRAMDCLTDVARQLRRSDTPGLAECIAEWRPKLRAGLGGLASGPLASEALDLLRLLGFEVRGEVAGRSGLRWRSGDDAPATAAQTVLRRLPVTPPSVSNPPSPGGSKVERVVLPSLQADGDARSMAHRGHRELSLKLGPSWVKLDGTDYGSFTAR